MLASIDQIDDGVPLGFGVVADDLDGVGFAGVGATYGLIEDHRPHELSGLAEVVKPEKVSEFVSDDFGELAGGEGNAIKVGLDIDGSANFDFVPRPVPRVPLFQLDQAQRVVTGAGDFVNKLNGEMSFFGVGDELDGVIFFEGFFPGVEGIIQPLSGSGGRSETVWVDGNFDSVVVDNSVKQGQAELVVTLGLGLGCFLQCLDDGIVDFRWDFGCIGLGLPTGLGRRDERKGERKGSKHSEGTSVDGVFLRWDA